LTKIYNMTINQGLKEKNRLAGKLKVLDAKIQKSTSWIRSNQPAYDLNTLLGERHKMVGQLVTLKGKLSTATQPVFHVILEMAEQKAYIQLIRGLELTTGLKENLYGNQAPVEYQSAMTEEARDGLIENAENHIAALQDQLDKFNATTEI